MKTRLYLLVAGFCALALAAVASGAGTATPGVSSTQVLIGGTTPLTGIASAYSAVARGADAYFKYVNAHGGVNRRKVKYLIRDDGYDPSRTIDQTRELVQQDKVFAIFNSLGTEQNQATRDYLNAVKVPQLFVASGATTWGRDYRRYPWTIGYQPNYIAEGTIYGRHVAKTTPKARIGVLYQNDDYGKDLLNGLRKGLASKVRQIVSRQSYDVTDPDVGSQIARLKSARANVLMLFATPATAIRAYVHARKLDWRPKVFVNAVSSAANIMGLATAATSKKQTEGSISIVFLKDPTDRRWANDPGIRLYRSVMKRYDAKSNWKDVYNVYGMSVAHTFVQALKRAGKNPTRESIMRAATHLNVRNDPFVLPGIAVRTREGDHFPLDQAKLERYHNGHWVAFGGLFRVR